MYNRPDGSIVVEFFVKPVGSVRQNWRSRFREDRLGERIEAYNNYKATLRDAMAITMKQQDIKKFPKGPLWAKADFYFTTPEEVLSRPADIDNLLKGVLDSCNGVLIRDDRYIISAECKKRLSDGSEMVIFAIGAYPYELESTTVVHYCTLQSRLPACGCGKVKSCSMYENDVTCKNCVRVINRRVKGYAKH